jgi:hypothetical protein
MEYYVLIYFYYNYYYDLYDWGFFSDLVSLLRWSNEEAQTLLESILVLLQYQVKIYFWSIGVQSENNKTFINVKVAWYFVNTEL